MKRVVVMETIMVLLVVTAIAGIVGTGVGGLLGALNRLLGAAVGFVEAVLIASLVVMVLSLFPGMMSFLNGSIILTALYQFNPLMWLITLFLTL